MCSQSYGGRIYTSGSYRVYHVTYEELRAQQYRKRANALLILFWVTFCIVAGGGLAWLLTPWLQALAPVTDRQFGTTPQVYRDLSSSLGIASYALLWLSMGFGLLISGKMARVWPGGPEAFELHRFSSLLALGFTLFHVLVLAGDPYLGGTPVALVMFGMLAPKAPWSWVGQLSLYLMVLLVASFYIRKWIGRKAWRLLHAATFMLYLVALSHSVGASQDSSIPILGLFYWTTASCLVVMAALRSVIVLKGKRKRTHRHKPKLAVART